MFEVDSFMASDVDKQVLIYEVAVPSVLDHVKSGDAIVFGPINLKLLALSMSRAIGERT